MGTRRRESRACTGGRPGRPGSLGAQPTPPPRPLPCPGGGPRLTGKSCRRQPHVGRPAGAAGERGGGSPAECLPVPGYPAKPRVPGTQDGTRTGAREKRPQGENLKQARVSRKQSSARHPAPARGQPLALLKTKRKLRPGSLFHAHQPPEQPQKALPPRAPQLG